MAELQEEVEHNLNLQFYWEHLNLKRTIVDLAYMDDIEDRRKADIAG